MRPNISWYFSVIFLMFALNAHGDVNRVYHPYVEQQEREIEYSFVLRDAGDTNVLLNRAGVGYAWTDKFFSEIYVLTESMTHDNQQVRGYEAEFKWQLTEQGEYWADWGMLVEVGRGRDIDNHEIAAGLLWEKEMASKWIATANIFVEYEYGRDVENELENAFRGQIRYRSHPYLETGVEVHMDDQDKAMGPLVMGNIKLTGRKKLSWEIGLLIGIDSLTPGANIRGGIELEF
jgi:hypothetical protein